MEAPASQPKGPTLPSAHRTSRSACPKCPLLQTVGAAGFARARGESNLLHLHGHPDGAKAPLLAEAQGNVQTFEDLPTTFSRNLYSGNHFQREHSRSIWRSTKRHRTPWEPGCYKRHIGRRAYQPSDRQGSHFQAVVLKAG